MKRSMASTTNDSLSRPRDEAITANFSTSSEAISTCMTSV